MAGAVKALILAGGLGTRLKPLTDALPKCLVPIAGRPLLDYWVERLATAGVREARVNNHAHPEQVREFVNEVTRTGRLKLDESYEPKLLGSAGTISANADLANDAEEIIIIYADNLSDVDLGRMLTFHRSHGDPFTMLLFRAPVPRACGIAELDNENRVISFVEKPEQPKSDLANGGVYIVTAAAYREIAAMKAFDIGFDVIPKFVGRMRGWPWEGYHLDVGTHEALEKARRDAPGLRIRPHHGGPAGQPAIFLDRDGTIIEHVHYLSNPQEVRILPGIPESIKRIQADGYACVVVTNQSAVGRGKLTVERLHEIHAEMNRQLALDGVTLDAIYYCPEAPSAGDRTVVEHNDRKPGPGMLLRAADELGLDLSESWIIGDMISDVLAGINAGCRGNILVRTGNEAIPSADDHPNIKFEILDDVPAAIERILREKSSSDSHVRTSNA